MTKTLMQCYKNSCEKHTKGPALYEQYRALLLLDCKKSLILAMVVVGWEKYTRAQVCISPTPRSPQPELETTRSQYTSVYCG